MFFSILQLLKYYNASADTFTGLGREFWLKNENEMIFLDITRISMKGGDTSDQEIGNAEYEKEEGGGIENRNLQEKWF